MMDLVFAMEVFVSDFQIDLLVLEKYALTRVFTASQLTELRKDTFAIFAKGNINFNATVLRQLKLFREQVWRF